MEDSAAFRIAAAPASQSDIQIPSGPQDSQVKPESVDVEPALSIYEEINGKPYTADFFGLGLYMGDDMFTGTQDSIRELDRFVQSEIETRGLTNSIAAYEEVIAELEKQIGSYDNEESLSRMLRLSTAAKAISRLRSVTKQPILSGESLNPSEYSIIFGKRHVS